MPNPSIQDLQDLLQQLLPAIQSSVDFIRHERRTFSRSDVEHKSYNDLVSYVDRTAEEQLTEACGQIIPGSGFIREEGNDIHSQNDFRWIIDPLDGTTNFIHDLPAYCISLALQHQEKTVLGVVHDVTGGEVFTAIKGGGAYKDGQPIRVSAMQELRSALLGMGFPYAKSDKGDDYLAVLKEFLGKCRGMRRFGSAALDLAWVACGRLDGFYETGLQAWDVAAGALLILEAGGKVSDYKGTDNYVFGRKVVGSNGHIHGEMLEVVRNLR